MVLESVSSLLAVVVVVGPLSAVVLSEVADTVDVVVVAVGVALLTATELGDKLLLGTMLFAGVCGVVVKVDTLGVVTADGVPALGG